MGQAVCNPFALNHFVDNIEYKSHIMKRSKDDSAIKCFYYGCYLAFQLRGLVKCFKRIRTSKLNLDFSKDPSMKKMLPKMKNILVFLKKGPDFKFPPLNRLINHYTEILDEDYFDFYLAADAEIHDLLDQVNQKIDSNKNAINRSQTT
ncbi:MAG: hypothetical protein PHW04_04840 [Candidatus Wallbacteria bacterium]|nr:hypothetical protein [Candidatus Wallbacteria bacterium]